MALETYRKKRNFRITPEPKGIRRRVKKNGLSFVIQKHSASHLHYDFRLELNGVLLSWAVPKGPSLDPDDKRLAMQVEDHPIEYGEFEGIIPAKQYGAGTVLLWDRGVWVPKEDPVAGYKKGKLKFTLEGDKLQGGWTLVRSHGSKYGGDKAWLLIKEDDEMARRGIDTRIVDDRPKSVSSGRSIEEIAAQRDRVWHSNKSVKQNVNSGAVKKGAGAVDPSKIAGAVKQKIPPFIEPQLATLVKASPDGEEWIEEVKFDGYRMLCRIDDGEARFYSRNNKEWTANFPSIADAAARLPIESAWLDGEVVKLDGQGRSSFQSLQNALSLNEESTLLYFIFDIPYLNGFDMRKVPLMERKQVLESVMAAPPDPLRLSFYQAGGGVAFFGEACKLGLEGMIAKAATSRYSGRRNRDWVKVKCGMRQEMVIGGFTDPQGSRSGFGALLLGVYEDGKLRYSGKVGTGFNDDTLQTLRKQLDALEQDKPAFSNPPRGGEARRSHWVKPRLVAQIEFTEWTHEGTLRHPSFQGLREDKKATQVIRERATGSVEHELVLPNAKAKVKVKAKAKAKANTGKPAKSVPDSNDKDAVAGIHLSNPAKLLYPEAKLGKHDLARYYEAVAQLMLPHLKQRPLSLLRCPDGWGKDCFYQKNVDGAAHDAIDRVKVSTSDGPALYMMANSTAALVALVQMGALEIHPWGATADHLHHPDRIVFDFDPDDDVPWKNLVEAVRLIETLLGEIGLKGFLKTTGGKGLHVVVPVKPTQPWPVIKGFSKGIADLFSGTFPDRFTSRMSKAARHGKIFIDYLRNDEGSTAIAPYSLRARANAPVSTPIAWDELSKEIRFDHFNVKTVLSRIKKMKTDPWQDFFHTRQSINAKMLKKIGYEAT